MSKVIELSKVLGLPKARCLGLSKVFKLSTRVGLPKAAFNILCMDDTTLMGLFLCLIACLIDDLYDVLIYCLNLELFGFVYD